MKSVLLTGASGFIGQWLAQHLQKKDYRLLLGNRECREQSGISGRSQHVLFDLEDEKSITTALKNSPDVVIHLAGLAHNHSRDKEKIYRVNAEGTERLAKIANNAGVKLFIYISTIKVHGKLSYDRPFTEYSPISAEDDYALSKLKAEQALRDMCDAGEMQYIVLRPPLVYGPGVKANFMRLLTLIDKNTPLPLAGFNNCRSYIYVENLCHIIERLIHRDSCKNQVYLVKDFDLSTKDLVSEIALAFGKPAKLFNVPGYILRIIAGLMGKTNQFESLYNNLCIDDSKLKNELGSGPEIEMSTSIASTVNWYRNSHKDKS